MSAWTPSIFGLAVAAVVGYLLVIDVMLPIGRSKLRICIDLAQWIIRALLRDDAWYLRVLAILAIVIAAEIGVDLLTHN